MLTPNHYRLLFAVAVIAIVFGVALGSLPMVQFHIASGQPYGYSGPISTGPVGSNPGLAPPPTPSPTPISPHDPFIGAAAPAALRVPDGTMTVITAELVQLRWQPLAGTGNGLTVRRGQEFPVSGVDETGEWVRITVGQQSSWVRRNETNLPRVRVQDDFSS